MHLHIPFLALNSKVHVRFVQPDFRPVRALQYLQRNNGIADGCAACCNVEGKDGCLQKVHGRFVQDGGWGASAVDGSRTNGEPLVIYIFDCPKRTLTKAVK